MSYGSDLLSSGRRIGQLVWFESRLFEATGRWIATTPEPAARAFLATASGHHGWHAELLSGLLPLVVDGPTAAEFVTPSPEQRDAVAELDSMTLTVERFRRVWGTLVPRVVTAAESHISSSSSIAEAATHRLLRIVIADERADIESAERIEAELIGMPSPRQSSR
jgi:hypothetical protein